ncbi:Glyoxalase/Bleomycin resistance protein/Dihydroxybiphenyl dioxygenase [Cladorrhinum sp. PSN332]|nr:Glyoxalase/Bleomycin resistance protein/Dihydroxybiphenyl dioxygenase [Cladorrhinum sp. PSN332]
MARQSNFTDHITKFSTKPPGHDAARQRENQRRHRARVKGRIVELEDALSSTQRELENALKQIDNLNAEVQRLQSLIPIPQTTARAESTSITVQPPDCEPHPQPSNSPSVDCQRYRPAGETAITPARASSIGDPDDCPLLPAPLPGESTITCREAYSIINDRNAPSDIDTSTMNEWLKEGFRRANAPGSGSPAKRCQGPGVPPVLHDSTTMSHHNPLSHISLPIRSLPRSRQFYTAVLAPLGLSLVYDSTVSNPTKTLRILGYGPDPEHELLNLFEYPDVEQSAAIPGPGFHVAFNAPSREAVKEFHAKALENGGKDRGEPGLREAYGRGYYAAFVEDVDGWRVEAVCKLPEVALGEEPSEAN